jgi:hypothetical protein
LNYSLLRLFLLAIALFGFAVNCFGQDQDTLNGGELGTACYYSPKLHGRKTSSGERYHRKKYTCAHKWLPLGTLVRVSNLENGKSVIVTVNDRGPFTKKYQIDLSEIAASEIQIKGNSKNKVSIVPLETPEGFISVEKTNDDAERLIMPQGNWFEPGLYYNDLGELSHPFGYGLFLKSESEVEAVNTFCTFLKRKNKDRSLFILPEINSDGNIHYNIYVGSYETLNLAKKARKQLLKENLKGNQPLIRKYAE